jgi:hypothetical protein
MRSRDPEEAGWICILLLPDGRVLRLDPTHGRGVIRMQRADTTIAYSEEMDDEQQRMYGRELAAARTVAART